MSYSDQAYYYNGDYYELCVEPDYLIDLYEFLAKRL